MNSNLAAYLTVGEAAEVLGVSAGTLRNWDNNRKLKTLRHPKNGYRIYRREDLEALLQHEGLRLRLYQRFAPHFDWGEVSGSDHLVQFYESDSFLAASVSRFIEAGLRAGEGAVLIATPPHRNAIQRALRARGLDLSASRASGQLVSLDAAETLAEFMRGRSPDRKLFRDLIGGVVARVAAGRSGVRAFGEMVALLWGAGNPEAAVRLEGLWNELRAKHAFILQCAYPMGAFEADGPGSAFGGVCACHSRVIPAESYAGLSTEEERLRAIAELQQKALSLDAEVERGRRIQRALRAHRQHLPTSLKALLATIESHALDEPREKGS